MSIDDKNMEQFDAHGKPVTRPIPIEYGCAELIGGMKGEVQVKGDILSSGVKWDAES